MMLLGIWAACLIAQDGPWIRQIGISEYGYSAPANAHPLAYYQMDPCLRNDPKDRISQCTPQPGKYDLELLRETRAKLRLVGRIGVFQIYELEYFAAGQEVAGIRSVLIGTSQRQLHEVHVQVNTSGSFLPTQIVQSGDRQLLVKVKWDDGGIYHGVYEDYLVLSGAKFIRLDLRPLSDAAAKAVPPGFLTYQPASGYDLKTMTYRISTERKGLNVGPKVGCCEGHIDVPFKIVEGRVIPGKATFHP